MAMKLLMKATVRSVTDVAESTRAYELAPAKRERFPSFEPGAHVTVQLPNSLKRQYSLCSDPRETCSYRIAVLCEEHGRGGSRFMHHHIRPGDTLYIRYPDNRFAIAGEALHHVLIAALHQSYAAFRPGELPFTGDIAALMAKTVAGAFRVGVQLAAPFLIFGLVFNISLGLLSRLMPQMQVFFVGLPLSILLGFVILLLVVGAMMGTFLSYFGDVLRDLGTM